MATNFEIGKTYLAGWQEFPYLVLSRTEKTVLFKDLVLGNTVRRKIHHYSSNGSEWVDMEKSYGLSSEDVKEGD